MTEKVLREKGLAIVGSRDGFFDEAEEDAVREINKLKPNILMVGMGTPKQEKWIYNHLNELDVNLCWGVGAAFEWLSGYRKRAPRWMVECGFEWLYRLYQQPKRLWKRYLVGNLVFIYHVLHWKNKTRMVCR
jgi:N-acetylglucosaminyldiphosphoundecaprenol N-acetyl-beta-D-mannosaminyltransferase